MDDAIRIEVSISPMFSVNAHYRTVIEIDREEWEDMNEQQREEYMREETERILYEKVDVSWKTLD